MNKMYVGIVKFARCRKKIDRKTGRKMMIPNDESEHLVRKDESVRIISDEVFEQVQERLRSRSQQQKRSHLTPSTWAFTKVLVCGACGKPFYASKSTAKGHVYRRYVCGTRQRLGTDCCPNKTRISEERIMNQVSEAFKALFDDADAIVAEATKRAEVHVASNCSDAARIRQQLRALDKTCDAHIRLLEDPDIEELAKRAISRWRRSPSRTLRPLPNSTSSCRHTSVR